MTELYTDSRPVYTEILTTPYSRCVGHTVGHYTVLEYGSYN